VGVEAHRAKLFSLSLLQRAADVVWWGRTKDHEMRVLQSKVEKSHGKMAFLSAKAASDLPVRPWDFSEFV
jgi:hypothetical protein